MKSIERSVIIPYLSVLFLIGLFFVFHNTPLTGLDERFHFFRSLQISQGDLLAKEVNGEKNAWGGCLDGKMMWYTSLFNNNQDKNLPTSKADAIAFSNTVNGVASREDWCINFASSGSFSPLMYLPSAIGIKMADLSGFGVHGKLMSGRLFNLVGYIALLGWLIYVMPIGKIPTLFIFSFPTLINLASSYSADPITNLVTMLFIAYTLRMALLREIHVKKIIALSVLTGLVKLTNVTMLPLVLLIPSSVFIIKKKYYLFISSVLFVGLVSALLWNMHFKFVPSEFWHSGGNITESKEMLLSDPVGVVRHIILSIYHQSEYMLVNMYSTFGGGPSLFTWQPASELCFFSIFIILTYTLLFENSHVISTNLIKIVIPAMCGIGSILLIYLAFYMGFSPVKSAHVLGVQGRYFMLSFFAIICSMMLINKKPVLRELRLDVENYGDSINIKIALIFIYLGLITIACSMSIGRYISMY